MVSRVAHFNYCAFHFTLLFNFLFHYVPSLLESLILVAMSCLTLTRYVFQPLASHYLMAFSFTVSLFCCLVSLRDVVPHSSVPLFFWMVSDPERYSHRNGDCTRNPPLARKFVRVKDASWTCAKFPFALLSIIVRTKLMWGICSWRRVLAPTLPGFRNNRRLSLLPRRDTVGGGKVCSDRAQRFFHWHAMTRTRLLDCLLASPSGFSNHTAGARGRCWCGLQPQSCWRRVSILGEDQE